MAVRQHLPYSSSEGKFDHRPVFHKLHRTYVRTSIDSCVYTRLYRVSNVLTCNAGPASMPYRRVANLERYTLILLFHLPTISFTIALKNRDLTLWTREEILGHHLIQRILFSIRENLVIWSSNLN